MKSALNGVHGAPKFKGLPPRQKLINRAKNTLSYQRAPYHAVAVVLVSNIKYHLRKYISKSITGWKRRYM